MLDARSKRFEALQRRLHALLQGDAPLAGWLSSAAERDDGPWAAFVTAADRLARHDRDGARAALREIVTQPGLHSRHYLEAWTALRELGDIPPAEQAGLLHGVVLDLPVASGVDVVVAYADGSARYLGHGGNAVIWDSPPRPLEAAITGLLDAARRLLPHADRWSHGVPALDRRLARVTLLTAGGLNGIQRPVVALAQDGHAAPVLAEAAYLMVLMVQYAL